MACKADRFQFGKEDPITHRVKALADVQIENVSQSALINPPRSHHKSR